jgi:hypothetical protein
MKNRCMIEIGCCYFTFQREEGDGPKNKGEDDSGF